MRTKPTLLSEFASRLSFPDYFGRNWDALVDCLSDLRWLPGSAYVIIVDGSQELLADEPSEVPTFLDAIEAVGRANRARRMVGSASHPVSSLADRSAGLNASTEDVV